MLLLSRFLVLLNPLCTAGGGWGAREFKEPARSQPLGCRAASAISFHTSYSVACVINWPFNSECPNVFIPVVLTIVSYSSSPATHDNRISPHLSSVRSLLRISEVLFSELLKGPTNS